MHQCSTYVYVSCNNMGRIGQDFYIAVQKHFTSGLISCHLTVTTMHHITSGGESNCTDITSGGESNCTEMAASNSLSSLCEDRSNQY